MIKQLLISFLVMIGIAAASFAQEYGDTLSDNEDFDMRLEQALRRWSIVLTKKDSLALEVYRSKIVNYRNNEEYLSTHKQIINIIVDDPSVPFTVELAKLTIVDDVTVMNLLFQNFHIEKRNPVFIDTYERYINIFLTAFASSYEKRAIFLKMSIIQF